MTKNKDVTNDFINGFVNRTQNLFIKKNPTNNILILYSYGYHFPLCIKLLDNTFLINSNGYSNTTARHKSLLCRDLGFNNFKDLEQNHNKDNIILMDTNELKRVIDMGFINKSQIMEDKV